MVGFWEDWVRQYPIVSIEDGLAEDDWDGWKHLTARAGQERFNSSATISSSPIRKSSQRGISEKIGNAILIKLNQIGTVTRNHRSHRNGAQSQATPSIVSHRSGETEDTFIADFVVAMGTGQIKTGSASRTDRIAKYNQLLRIEEELGAAARFPGRKPR